MTHVTTILSKQFSGNCILQTSEISKDTGVSLKGLQQIYNKGIGAYKTNPNSVRPNVKSKEQWAMARVYSSVMGGKASKIDANELKMEKGGLIAPNGKKSNLTPLQYKLVRSPEFKAWFGDWQNDPENASKVVDENGEPLVCYHQSNKKFTKFDYKLSYDGAIWFTSNIEKIKDNENKTLAIEKGIGNLILFLSNFLSSSLYRFSNSIPSSFFTPKIITLLLSCGTPKYLAL